METSKHSLWKGKSAVREALKGWVKQECIALLRLVLPIFFTTVFTQIIFLISLIFMGQISGGVLELDAAGLAVALINVTAMAIVIGMGTALDTLCSQAFGLKYYKRVGIILQQGILIIGLSLFPIWALWLNMESLLLLIGQDSCVVKLTSEYLITFGFALPFVFFYVLVSKYLQAQSVVFVLVVVGFITNVINVVLSSIFIYKLELGFMGAVLAMTLSQSAAPLFLLAYMWACGLHKQTWGGWSWESLVDWWTFTKLAIPGLLMLGFEWWSYEIGIIVVGTIDSTQLGIYIIVLNISTIIFMIPLAIAGAVTVRVGNELGAGNPLKAKRVMYIAAVVTFCEVTVAAVMLQALKYQLGKVFTSDEAVIQGVANMMNLISPFLYADHFQCILGGVVRGSGRQLAGAVINFITFYVVGQPVGITLALVAGMGALGHWIGLLCGATLNTLFYIFMLWRTDWEQQSLRAMTNSKLDSMNVSFKKEERDGKELKEKVVFSCGPGELRGEHEQSDGLDREVEGPQDGGLQDGGLWDGGLWDGGLQDGGLRDGGLQDGGLQDGGLRDGGLRDGGPRDGALSSPCEAEGEITTVAPPPDPRENGGLRGEGDEEDCPATSGNEGHDCSTAAAMSKIRLLLYRGMFLIFGATILVGGGLSSHFLGLQGNATSCEMHGANISAAYIAPSVVLNTVPSVTCDATYLFTTSLDMRTHDDVTPSIALTTHTLPSITPSLPLNNSPLSTAPTFINPSPSVPLSE